MSLACFDTLVGLSATEYECFTDETPDGFDDSDSGYYLTDTDYGLTVLQDCGIAGWGILDAARTQAIRETKTDLRAALRDRFNGFPTPFSGLIGQMKSTAAQSVTNTHAGLRIRARTRQKGVKLVIKKIYLALNTIGTYQITIRSNDPLFTNPANTPVTITVANTFTASGAIAIELPFWSDSCHERYLEYYIGVELAGANPRNNALKCCGNNPGWQKHMDVSGFKADTNDPEDVGDFSSLAYGFSLDAYLTCEELDWICELDELNGYYIKDVLARTVQFRGAALAISALLDSRDVNPCYNSIADNLNTKRNYLNQRWADNIAWIAQNVPSGVTDCFTCKPENTFQRGRMLV